MTTLGTARGWMVTINNPSEDYLDSDFMLDVFSTDTNVSYAVWQVERVTTLHIQMYVHFRTPQRLTRARKLFPGSHVEARRGTVTEAIDYCSKDDDPDHPRLAGPWHYGVPPRGQGSRSDLDQMTLMIKEGKSHFELAEEMPTMVIRFHRGIQVLESWLHKPTIREDLFVHVLWGPTGVGKSHRVIMAHPDLFIVPAPEQRMWFDNYVQQSVVLFDDFRTDWMKPSLLLRLLDKWPMTVEYKGGTTSWTPTKIFITTDSDPAMWYDSEMLTAQILRRITKIEHIPSR